jgi:hypothetical protein
MSIGPSGCRRPGSVATVGPILTATEREQVTATLAHASALLPRASTDPEM